MTGKLDHYVLVFFAALGLVAAGCLDLGPGRVEDAAKFSENKRPPLGLGLEIPASLPPPGPFVEGSELRILEDFLRDVGSDVVIECGRPGLARFIDESISRERHNNAITTVLSMCRVEPDLEFVNETREKGEEKDVYLELLDHATRAIHNASGSLADHPGPGNAVEAQFMARLMNRNFIEHRLLNRDISMWQEYENTTARDVEDLRKIFRNLESATSRSATLSEILERYPWGDPPCVSPDIRKLSEHIDKKIEKIYGYIELYGRDVPNAKNNNSRAHNRFLDTLVPQYEFAEERTWWPLMLSVDSLMSGNVAYWESYSHEAWPTLEEAEFMLAQHRNEGRSIWTEKRLYHYADYFRTPEVQKLTPWETEVNFGPPDFLGAISMNWPFEGLDCLSSE